MAEGTRSNPQQNRRERDSDRLRTERDHAALLLLLPLPLNLPHSPLQLRSAAKESRILLPQIMDPISLLPPLLYGNHLGGAVQERHGEPSGEASGEGEGGREAIGEVRGGAEEEGVGI